MRATRAHADDFRHVPAFTVPVSNDEIIELVETCTLQAGATVANIRSTATKTVSKTETVTKPLACEWGIPTPPPGETFAPTQVNVDVLANGQKQRLGNVPSAAECANFTNGWYYDDPANPTRIIACPDTCALVTGSGVTGVSVALGCATEVAVPK